MDIDALPPNTIAQLYNLVVRGIQPGAKKKRKSLTGGRPNGHGKRPGHKSGVFPGGGSGKGLSAGVKNEMEAERIKALEAELHRLNGGPGSEDEGQGPEDYYGAEDDDDDDDDGDEDLEGVYSEEEG